MWRTFFYCEWWRATEQCGDKNARHTLAVALASHACVLNRTATKMNVTNLVLGVADVQTSSESVPPIQANAEVTTSPQAKLMELAVVVQK